MNSKEVLIFTERFCLISIGGWFLQNPKQSEFQMSWRLLKMICEFVVESYHQLHQHILGYMRFGWSKHFCAEYNHGYNRGYQSSTIGYRTSRFPYRTKIQASNLVARPQSFCELPRDKSQPDKSQPVGHHREGERRARSQPVGSRSRWDFRPSHFSTSPSR